MPTWVAKGKARDLSASEGAGGQDGIVLPLQVSGSGTTDIIYALAVKIGPSQSFSLQVDTGSSDLWVTSKACSSSLCAQTNGHSYDPSSSTSSGSDFTITYLSGKVEGPVVWDTVEIGGYSIENQAFAAASSISSEPLSSDFNGILGLALPLNSIISGLIPPVLNNAPDGAAWASNLFSITPISSAPGARFLSLSLSRPGDDRTPATLGIGRHPSFVSSQTSNIQYETLVADKIGTLYWKVDLRAITVYANGVAKPVEVGRSGTGAVFPNAILDSGAPLILTTSKLANGIYGAIGIGPASDGQYYVPCDAPLNLTITLDDRSEIPVHPLDLTAEPPTDNQAQYCIGLIQAADGVLGTTTSVGDVILGVPFLRNVYSVMAYTPPYENGSFPRAAAQTDGSIRPLLGLLGLTDPTQALDDFHRVRVLKQPISPAGGGSSSSAPPAGGSSSSGSGSARRGLSVGIIVLISLLAFFALCFTLFAVRWWLYGRRYRRGGGRDKGGDELTAFGLAEAAAAAAAEKKKRRRRHKGFMRGGEPDVVPTEDVMRDLRYEAYMQYNQANDTSVSATPAPSTLGHAVVGADDGHRQESNALVKGKEPPGIGVALAAVSSHKSGFSDDSDGSHGGQGHGHSHSGTGADELGYKPVHTADQSWWPDDTLVNSRSSSSSPSRRFSAQEEHGWIREENPVLLEGDTLRPASYPPLIPLTPPSPTHQRSFSAVVPLLDAIDGGHTLGRTQGGFDEFGLSNLSDEEGPGGGGGGGGGGGMAGVGTAARNSRLGPGLQRESYTDSNAFGGTLSR